MKDNITKILFWPINRFNIILSWKKSEYQFKRFVDKWKLKNKSTEELSGNIGIVIQPFKATQVSWFLIAFALFFTQRHKQVTIILDDIVFGIEKFSFFNYQIKSIQNIIAHLPSSIKIIELSKLREKKNFTDSIDYAEIDRLALLNSVHFMKGEHKKNGRKQYFDIIHAQLENGYPKIKQLFDENHFDFMIITGGIWGSTGLYLKLAKLNKIRISTFDASYGVLLLSTNGIAAQQSDIPIAFYQLEDIFSSKILKIANEKMEKRKLGADIPSNQLPAHQKTPYIENKYINDVGILLLPNSVWDTAVLGLHTVFETMTDWIIETIEWVIENTDEVITIRQHPAERNPYVKSNDDYRTLINQKFGNNGRINFISATDDINTYNLIDNSCFVVSFSSTTSMEAVVMGKVVVNVSSCYYSNLGFVYNAKTKEGYFNHLKDALSGKIKISKEQKEDALKCYYLTQCCNPIQTNFTPQISDFEKWVKEDPEDLFNSDAVQDCLHALENGIPISLIQHHKNVN